MGVYLCGGDVGVAKHHLHGAQVCTVAEEMGGKRVSDHVGRDILVDAGCQGCFSNYLPEPQPCHATAAAGNKEIIASFAFKDEWPRCFQILLYLFFCLVSKGDQSFLIAFA